MALTYVKSSGLDTTGNYTVNALSITANVTSGNANLGNLATANFFSGNGHYLTAILGTQISGEVAYANKANSVAVANVSGIGNIATINKDGNASNILYGNGVFSAAPAGGGGGGTSVIVSSTQPGTANNGDLWLNTTTSILTVYYSSAWINVSANNSQILSTVNNFTGDNTTTNFTLTNAPVSKDYMFVAVGGILQPRTTYSVSGNVLTLSSAAPSNTPVDVTVIGGQATPISTAFSVSSSSQPNITSVGTLTSLVVSGNITTGNANLGNLTTSNFFSGNGSLLTSIAGGNVTGAVAYATTANSVAGGNVSGTVTNSTTAGTVISASQPNITSTGTLTSLSVSGNATFSSWTTFQQSNEVINTKTGATGVVAHDLSTGATFYHTSPAANFTANFTNVATTDSRTIVAALIIVQGATPYVPTAVQIDGTAQTIKWLGSTAPTGTASKTDVVSFSLVRVSATWSVYGQYSNYG